MSVKNSQEQQRRYCQLLITHKKNIVAEHILNVLEQFAKIRFNIQFDRQQQCIKRCKTDQNKK